MADAGGAPAVEGEAPRGIEPEPVARFLAEHVPGADAGPLAFELIAGGRSNLTYRVRGPRGPWILRRPPLGHVLPTAHDMAREHRVLSALAGTALPVPRPFALCEDAAVTGAPFYVMEDRPGVVVGDALPEGFAESEAERERLSRVVVETLAALHAVDPESVGLGDFGRPEGYLERQVRRWRRQWEASKTGEAPAVEACLERLAAAIPEPSPAAIVHGDYRLGNLALDPSDPARIVGIFDWEMATLGDPLADLGYLLIYWGEPGDALESLGAASAMAATARPGFLPRDALVEAYAEASGRDVSAIDFYRVLALTKLAVISEGIYARHLQGKTVGEGFEGMARASAPLAERALAIADVAPEPALRGG